METKICSKCGKELPVECFNKDKSHKDGLRSNCRDCQHKHNKENKLYYSEYHKKYYIKNKEKIKAKSIEYNNNNADKKCIYMEQYRKNNKDKACIYTHNRRAKTKNNGGTYTEEQWQECLDFFNNKCAYSGEVFDEIGIGKISKDHVLAIDNNGCNFIWNIVPMCLNYNSSKNNNYMEEWYKQQPFFSEERLQHIYEWQEYSYKKWGYLEEIAV